MRPERPHWPILLAFGTLMMALLACGGFQVRVTPTVAPPEAVQPASEPTVTLTRPSETPTQIPPPTAAPSATPTLAPTPASLAPGGQARVTAGGGLNVREQPSAKGKQLGRLNANAVVTLVEGPTQAEDYEWWKIDNGSGLVGWVASGPENEPWLVPAAEAAAPAQPSAGPKLVDRPIKLGDRVQVTTDPGQLLTVRDYAGTSNTTPVAKAVTGTLFTVRGGPIKQDGYTWWELEGDTVKGWAAEGDSQNRWLTPVE